MPEIDISILFSNSNKIYIIASSAARTSARGLPCRSWVTSPSPGADTPSWDIKNGVLKILENGFIDNKLGILVFLYFDGAILEPFLDKQYGEYKSRDFFSSNIVWDDGYGEAEQRLDGVVFYE